ncbi:MAG: carboxypeptidase M32 [Proteobacteria bacterium]|nr:carboxypeptidase M32 [Pseudomonadota bacterium]
MKAYPKLEAHFGRIGRLAAVEGLLHWDTETMLPPGAAADRGEQLAALRTVLHELETAPQLPELLDRAADEALDDWQRANLHEMRRRVRHQQGVPAPLVAALARAGTECVVAWREARARDDFAALLPRFERVVALVRERATAKGELLRMAPYDALLDEYEPGLHAVLVDEVFDALASFLPQLIASVIERQAAQPAPMPWPVSFPIERQRVLAERVMTALGFDSQRGRLDRSAHPFCGGSGGDDVRITARWREDSFVEGLQAVAHETGHALYEQGLPAAWRFQPVGQARGMMLHESQSLLVEMQACRSRPFLSWLAPQLGALFGAGPAGVGGASPWSVDNLERVYRRVARSLIRVDADEVTYPAHVILRYRLERALLSGALPPRALPAAWRDGMQELVGVAPPDDRQGCLQDIHWMDGTFGYFPTYTLGAIAAAQLHEAAMLAEPGLPAAIAVGDFQPLLDWLRANVHAHASRLSGEALLQAATGRGLEVGCFRTHLERRYLG